MLKFQSKYEIDSLVAPGVRLTIRPLGPRPKATIASETSRLAWEIRDLSNQLAVLREKYPALQPSEETAETGVAAVPPDVLNDFLSITDQIRAAGRQIECAYVERSLVAIEGVEVDRRAATVAEFLDFASSVKSDQLFTEVLGYVNELLKTGSIDQQENKTSVPSDPVNEGEAR